MRSAAAVSMALLVSSLAIPVSHAADGDVATAWADPQTITSGTSGLVLSDTATMGSLSVAVVSRSVGGGGGVEFDIYTGRAQ